MTTYGVTGASGKLGRLVLEALMQIVEGDDIVVALVRDPAKLADFTGKSVEVRTLDYDTPASLEPALRGIDRLLLISGNALGQRPRQHAAVIAAAKEAGVGYLAYTSILDAPNTPIKLGEEHRATEQALIESGLTHDILRNGWYNENYVMSLPAQIEAGVITGAQGQGRISSASRGDYAEAAAVILVHGEGGEAFELAGDTSWNMEDLAEEVSRQSGKTVEYIDMSEADYAASLVAAGMPEHIAPVIANSAHATSLGALENYGHTLSEITGHSTVPIARTVRQALD